MSQHHNLYLVRHAQSEYNLAQLNALKSEVELREVDDLTVKFDKSLIDCSVSELGKKQAVEAGEKLKDVNGKLVITSPLRRCLETTHGIFQNHKNKPKVVVWPVVKEMLLSGCDVADDLETIQREFPEYDFSLLNDFQFPELWLYYMFCKDQGVCQEYIDELFDQHSSREDAIKNAKHFLVEKLKTSYPKTIETDHDLVHRIVEAKKALKEKIKEVASDEAVVVVAHSRFLEGFTAEGFAEDGAPVNAKWFYNCEVTPYNLEDSSIANSL